MKHLHEEITKCGTEYSGHTWSQWWPLLDLAAVMSGLIFISLWHISNHDKLCSINEQTWRCFFKILLWNLEKGFCGVLLFSSSFNDAVYESHIALH